MNTTSCTPSNPQDDTDAAADRKTRISFEVHPSLLIEDELLEEMNDGNDDDDSSDDDDLLDTLLLAVLGRDNI